MKIWKRKLFVKNVSNGYKCPRAARFAFEPLEGRQMLTVTPHGGAVLPHVEVQGLYLGSDWLNNSTYYQQTGFLEGFLKTTVNSTYLDSLTNAGYGVGRGTFSPGKIDPVTINKSYYLNDSGIRSELQADIKNGALQAPDSNRLYVVFVEDNVAVRDSSGATSQSDFLGYHSAFAGTNASGQAVDIHYAVVAYPGGSIGNAAIPGLSALDGLTEVASHELAESITDPNVNYKTLGWYDDKFGEIGDITNAQIVYLNGYAVQRISDKNDQAMTPVGGTSSRPVSFILVSGGNLYEHTSAGFTFLAGNVALVSNQGVDNNGRAMVDFVTTSGLAYEFHDGMGSTYLASGVKDAKAGQGVSYVLLTNGSLYEEFNPSQQYPNGGAVHVQDGVVSLDAGTDRYGVSSVDVILTSGNAYEISSTSGAHLVASGVRAISAGQGGESEILLQNGNAYDYREVTNSSSFLASNVAQVTAGTDAAGNPVIDLLYSNGNLSEYRASSGWVSLGTGVKSVSKARAGLVDVLFSSGNAYEHTTSGFTYLTGSVIQAV